MGRILYDSRARGVFCEPQPLGLSRSIWNKVPSGEREREREVPAVFYSVNFFVGNFFDFFVICDEESLFTYSSMCIASWKNPPRFKLTTVDAAGSCRVCNYYSIFTERFSCSPQARRSKGGGGREEESFGVHTRHRSDAPEMVRRVFGTGGPTRIVVSLAV